jgi:UPF0755 protein
MTAPRRVLRLGLLLALLALAGGVWFYSRLERPLGAATRPQTTVFIPYGSSTSDIFRRLASEGIVSPAWMAELYYRIARSATPLQAGEYRFTKPESLSDVIARMSRGDVVRHTIVVPEGLTAEETFELFWSRGISRPEAFRTAFHDAQLILSIAPGAPDLEGFLFPDTYTVTRSTSARQIVEGMVANFRKHFGSDMRERASELPLTVRQAVTLASIVQKESGITSEEAVIAGVYWNRLRRGMRLQADPTVAYALKIDGKWSGTLYRSDYGYASPFNTYLTDGLPPGPICNPGVEALRAAVSPAKTEFLYFVADNSGGHVFSRTFEEHLDAISAARRSRNAAPAAPASSDSPSEPLSGNGGHETPPSR